MPYRVTKTYGHERGLSACFRQWRAESHCQLLHGYSLAVEIEFEADTLDSSNWVIDFGGLDWIKDYLVSKFDHVTLVAHNDPEINTFWEMHRKRMIDIVVVRATGCEAFAKMIFDHIDSEMMGDFVDGNGPLNQVRVMSVKVSEHGSNSATYFRGAA